MPQPRRVAPGPWILALLLAVVLTVPAHAGSTRLAALGGSGDYLRDDRSALRWYASAPDYPDLAVMELGRLDLDSGEEPWQDRVDGLAAGFHVQPGERWGTFIGYFHSLAEQSAASQVDAVYPGGSVNLGWGKRWGRYGAGLGFRGTSYADVQQTTGEPLTGREEYRHDYGLGLSADLGRGVGLEFAGELRQVISYIVDPDRDLNVTDSSSLDSYGLRLRALIPAGERSEIVPLLDISRALHGVYSQEMNDHADLDGWLLRAGGGLRTAPRPDAVFVVSAEYRNGRYDLNGTGANDAVWSVTRYDWWSIQLRMGLETRVLPWLTVRASLQYHRVDESEAKIGVPGQNPFEYEAAARVQVKAPLGLGVAVHAGDLRIDLSYNDHAPLSMGRVPNAETPREEARYLSLGLVYGF